MLGVVVRARRSFPGREVGERWRASLREAARLERAGLAIRLQRKPPKRWGVSRASEHHEPD